MKRQINTEVLKYGSNYNQIKFKKINDTRVIYNSIFIYTKNLNTLKISKFNY